MASRPDPLVRHGMVAGGLLGGGVLAAAKLRVRSLRKARFRTRLSPPSSPREVASWAR